jgi:hypothetical protein
MYRKKLIATTVETCKFRGDVRREGDAEVATCGLLAALIGCREHEWCNVGRDACDACCQSFPPSKNNVNPVIASLVYEAARRIMAAKPAGCDLRRIQEAGREVAKHLGVVYPADQAAIVRKPTAPRALCELVPRPQKRRGRRVRHWAVGVTTAPRREPTLEACLESLSRAGWERPYLFIDSAVRIPDRFSDLPGTFRDEKLGAWPNYYLALMELLMRRPHADAYLIVQDDVVFFDRENLRAYLEEMLWPGSSTPLVSLYCSEADSRPEPGWHQRQRGWVSGAHAFVFPPPLAKAFVMDRPVFQHRWAADPVWAVCVDDVIHHWAKDRRLEIWFPSPSLAQHVGDASTLWPAARALGSRRADRFAGDL